MGLNVAILRGGRVSLCVAELRGWEGGPLSLEYCMVGNFQGCKISHNDAVMTLFIDFQG